MNKEEIIKCFLNIDNVGNNEDLSLFRGLSADILTIFDIYRIYPEKLLLDKLNNCLYSLENNIKQCKQCNFGYGLSGILYTLALLTNNGFVDTKIALYNRAESIIQSHIMECVRLKNYDPLFGLVGYGQYYLELSVLDANKRQKVWDIIEQLITMMIIDHKWCYWEYLLEETDFDKKNNKVSLLSFLHGFPSILAFLYLCEKKGFVDADIAKCIKLGVSTICNCINEYPKNSFPELLVNSNGRYTTYNYSPVPSFYCRGDLALLNLLHEMDNKHCDIKYKAMVNKSIKTLLESKNNYYCFCHGLAGKLYFLKKFNNEHLNLNTFTKSNSEILSNFIKENSSNLQQGLLNGYNGMIMSLLFQDNLNTYFERVLLLKLDNQK